MRLLERLVFTTARLYAINKFDDDDWMRLQLAPNQAHQVCKIAVTATVCRTILDFFQLVLVLALSIYEFRVIPRPKRVFYTISPIYLCQPETMYNVTKPILVLLTLCGIHNLVASLHSLLISSFFQLDAVLHYQTGLICQAQHWRIAWQGLRTGQSVTLS